MESTSAKKSPRSSFAWAVAITAIVEIAAGVGCRSSAHDDEPQRATSASFTGEESFTSLRSSPPNIPAPIDIQPANGAVFEDGVTDLPITFAGFTDVANQQVEVQVLADPNAPISEASWVTIATTQTAATPTSFNDPAPIFRYSVVATPAPRSQAERWEQGGLLRYRVIAKDTSGKATAVPFFDSTSGRCVAALGAKSWKEILSACKSPFSANLGAPAAGQGRAAALVSSAPEPADGFRTPPYLDRKGFIFDFETDDYYDFIDAPRTLDEFQFRFGFFDQPTQGGFDSGTIYYNLGDLGIGREMHCTTFTDRSGAPGTACYVRNYGVFGDGQPNFSGDPRSALRDAVRGERSFATVAMVKFGNVFSPPEGNDVQFFVYNAQDQIANRAQLDSIGFNEAIPNNCTNCHGGTYDRRTGVLTGASFLPFDPDAFLFSKRSGFTYEEQEDQFRELNALIKRSGAPPATIQLIDGTYGDKVDVPGQKANLDWIPPGWSTDEESKTIYREVYKPYCRTCHVSQTGDFAFMRALDFKKEAAKLTESVCKTNEMPIAEATLGQFWRSSARAYLVNALGLSTSCAPR